MRDAAERSSGLASVEALSLALVCVGFAQDGSVIGCSSIRVHGRFAYAGRDTARTGRQRVKVERKWAGSGRIRRVPRGRMRIAEGLDNSELPGVHFPVLFGSEPASPQVWNALPAIEKNHVYGG